MKALCKPFASLGRLRLPDVIFAAAAVALTIACNRTADIEQTSPPEPFNNPQSAYAIKVYVGSPGQERLIELGPAERMLAGSSNSSAEQGNGGTGSSYGTKTTASPLRRLNTIIEYPGGNGNQTTDTDVEDARFGLGVSGWFLLAKAAETCIAEANYPPELAPPLLTTTPWVDTDAEAGNEDATTGWYIFAEQGDFAQYNFRSCDQVLVHQEILLCAADKLAEAADSTRPVTWDGETRVVIPPQKTRDKFILRDMAINALAHMTRLSNVELNEGNEDTGSCLNEYQDILQDPSEMLPLAHFQVPREQDSLYFDPILPVTDANAKALTLGRLSYLLHIYRASGRLLRDLIEKSVEADMAGAEQQRAAAADPQVGLELMWGVRNDGDAPYNSLRHALRVLYGRWEIGPEPGIIEGNPLFNVEHGATLYDRECGGYRALLPTPLLERNALDPREDIIDALGKGFSARWSELPIRTTSQALISSTLDTAGIVISPAALDADFPAARAAVSTQLQWSAARDHGILDPLTSNGSPTPEWSAFLASPTGQAIAQTVAELSDEDLRFGLERAFNAYRLLTDEGTEPLTLQVQGKAGVTIAEFPEVSTELEELGGIVIVGGMPRRDLAIDSSALLGRAQVASQCHESFFNAFPTAKDSFQNAFMMGERLQLHLAHIAGILEQYAPGETEFITSTDLAAAELRQWAARGFASKSLSSSELRISIAGLVPDDLGVTNPSEMPQAMTVVRGAPWVADCVARLRDTCPLELPAGSILSGTSTVTELNDGYDVVFLIPSDGLPADVAEGTKTSEQYYIVAKNDPASSTGKGRVLAALAQREGVLKEPISDLRAELANRILGISSSSRAGAGLCVAADETVPHAYCIPGVERDFFVPLANELTQSSEKEDSWRHYLDLAHDAAARTDELGRQLIDLGVQRELRREGAQEQLGQLCGDFTSAPSLTVTGGELAPSETDGNINACFQEPSFDVLFLGPDRFAAVADPSQAIRDEYCQERTDGFCTPGTDIQYAALNLADNAGELLDLGLCASIQRTAAAYHASPSPGGNRSLDLARFSEAAYDSFASAADLEASLRRLHYAGDRDGSWNVTLNGLPLLAGYSTFPSSEPSTAELERFRVYPACKNIPENWSCSHAPDASDTTACCPGLAKTFDQAFATQGIAPVSQDVIRRKVEAALWHMGAMAGRIPKNTFSMPVPAVNFAIEHGDLTFRDAPAPIVYANGRFAIQGDVYKLDATTSAEVSAEDLQELGDAVPMATSYAESRANTGPAWRQQIYSAALSPSAPSSRYLLVDASNSHIEFNSSFQALDGKSVERDRLTQWIVQLAAATKGSVTPEVAGFEDLAKFVWNLSSDEQFQSPTREICQPTSEARGTMTEGFGIEDEFNGLTLYDWMLVEPGQKFASTCDIIPEETSCQPGLQWPGQQSFLHSTIPCTRELGPLSQAFLSPACAQNLSSIQDRDSDPPIWIRYYAPRLLRPKYCSPDERLELLLDNEVNTDGSAIGAIVDALLLSCISQTSTSILPPNTIPPPIDDIDDIALLEEWIQRLARTADDSRNSLFLERVPVQVVDDFKNGRVGTGVVTRGGRGQLLLQIATAIQGINDGWLDVGAAFRDYAGAIRAARLELDGVDLANRGDLRLLAAQQLDLDRQMAKGAVAELTSVLNVGSAALGDFGAITDLAGNLANSSIDDSFASKYQTVIAEGREDAEDAKTNRVSTVLANLADRTGAARVALNHAISAVKESTALALSGIVGIELGEDQAKFEAAKAAGADYYQTLDGATISLPVNTVLRRQYDTYRIRYERSLHSAKRLAYLARLAIEQRIAVRLDALQAPIGSLEAPSLWADDLCSLQGVDYEELASTQDEVSGSPVISDELIINNFADQFVGDYVQKLEELVEFYNVEYPFHEADDTAVLSLRDNLLGPAGTCFRESNNLLFHSEALNEPAKTPTAEPWLTERAALEGWTRHSCTDGLCLVVDSPRALSEPPLPPGGLGNYSWLHNVEENTLPTIEVDPSEPPVEQPLSPAPLGIVYQTVPLSGGQRYVLSWWDQARGTNGEALESSDHSYQVVVYSADWSIIASLTSVAMAGGLDGHQWSERRLLEFVAPDSKDYHFSFSASVAGVGPGSLLVSNVQLERATGQDNIDTAYEATSGSRSYTTGECGVGDSEHFRSAFEYRCERDRCFHELSSPFSLDATALNRAESSLVGKVAAGNYNYRHGSIALNLVGSNVLDCSVSDGPSCYGQGYLEYDLSHRAFNTALEDYSGEARCFNFGEGSIRGGKALATERVITLPVSSADNELLGSNAFTKPEFFGRPMNGLYRMRIYDSPALRWEQVDDIQIVLNYRYWSRVRRASTGR